MIAQPEIDASFRTLESRLTPQVARLVGESVAVRVGDRGENHRLLDFTRTAAPFVQKLGAAVPSCVLVVSKPEDWLALVAGTLTPTRAVTSGQLRIEGDLTLAMRLERAVF